MKAIAVLNWKNLKVAQEISRALAIVVAMNNSNFLAPNPTPNPTLLDVGAAISDLQNAQQQIDANGGGKVFYTARDTQRKLVRSLMSQLVDYVNNVANGDAAIILSAALAVKKTPVRRGRLAATDYINAKGIGESEVKVNWGTVEGAATYNVQMSNDVSPLVWQGFAGNLVTDTKVEISDLTSGDKLWFRVIAVNAAGEGTPSNPALVRVP